MFLEYFIRIDYEYKFKNKTRVHIFASDTPFTSVKRDSISK